MRKIAVRTTGRTRGSIIVVSVFTAICFAVIFSVSWHFWLSLLIQNDLAARVDALALACAARLNQNDQCGRMNNLLVRARELAIESQDASEAMQSIGSPLAGLSELLQDEADEGLAYVIGESQALTRATIDDVRAFVDSKGGALPGVTRPVLGAAGDTVAIESCQLGDQEKMDSNVLAEHTYADLRACDQEQGLIRSDSGVYRSGTSLPGRERQASVRLASLRPPRQNHARGAGLLGVANFRSRLTIRKCGRNLPGYLELAPSAVRVEIVTRSGPTSGGAHLIRRATAIAVAAGAGQPAPLDW